jgi:hypothetical protein
MFIPIWLVVSVLLLFIGLITYLMIEYAKLYNELEFTYTRLARYKDFQQFIIAYFSEKEEE